MEETVDVGCLAAAAPFRRSANALWLASSHVPLLEKGSQASFPAGSWRWLVFPPPAAVAPGDAASTSMTGAALLCKLGRVGSLAFTAPSSSPNQEANPPPGIAVGRITSPQKGHKHVHLVAVEQERCPAAVEARGFFKIPFLGPHFLPHLPRRRGSAEKRLLAIFGHVFFPDDSTARGPLNGCICV